MNMLIKRGAALLTAWLLGALARRGVGGPSPETAQEIEAWIAQALGLLLDLGVLVASAWRQTKGAPLPGGGRHPPAES